jgi:hypothetical protein
MLSKVYHAELIDGIKSVDIKLHAYLDVLIDSIEFQRESLASAEQTTVTLKQDESLSFVKLEVNWYYPEDNRVVYKHMYAKVAHNVHDKKTKRIIFSQLYVGWILEEELFGSEYLTITEQPVPIELSNVL